MTKTLPALKAYQGTHHRHDVLVISKPAEGLKGGEVGLFFDQEIGLEILRRVNGYQKVLEALKAHREAFARCNGKAVWREAHAKADALLQELGEAS